MNQFWQEFFDTDRSRKGTGAVKWDMLGPKFGNEDAIPLWIADMDFPTAPAVTEALVQRARHGLFGYNKAPANAKQAVCDWMQRRHNVHVEPDWVFSSPGVVDSMFHTLLSLTQPDDHIFIHQPLYGPFSGMTKKAGRPLVKSALIETDTGYEMDFADMEQKFAAGNIKAMFFCNPHNPCGRIWTGEEIARVIKLCNKYNVLLIADEIHLDFELDGKCTSLLAFPEIQDNLIVYTASTKTFNLAGLKQSSVIIPNADIRAKVQAQYDEYKVVGENIFGILAQTTAYETGDEYVNNLCEYLAGNAAFCEKFINEQMPYAKCHHLQGTYLLWVDFTALTGKISHDDLWAGFAQTAGAAVGNGKDFGEGGEMHMRVNLATQRDKLAEAMNRMKAWLETL